MKGLTLDHERVETAHQGPDAHSPAGAVDFELDLPGFYYSDLYRPDRLRDLAHAFYTELGAIDSALNQRLASYLEKRGEGFEKKAESELLIAAAPHLSAFVARLFGVQSQRETQIDNVSAQDPVFTLKSFVARRALKRFPPEQAITLDVRWLDLMLGQLRCLPSFSSSVEDDDELEIASLTVRLLNWEKEFEKKPNDQTGSAQAATSAEIAKVLAELAGSDLEAALSGFAPEAAVSAEYSLVKSALSLVEAWASAHATQPEGRERVRGWVSFHQPRPLDYQHLVQIERPDESLPELMHGQGKNMRRRVGFELTDRRATSRQVLDEVDYCLYCHERDKDSCSKGLHERDGRVKRNPLGIPLEGCPLDEKISEMHVLKKQGDSIAALALVMIDNPMVPGTGHRICNDCMKSCIFQKQEPVNIPQAETGILTDVLNLPYGFEIYALLSRWNPINAKRPYALPYNGKNVLVVGLGPAGYTLAHYLLNEGFGVVGIDALKIEPLDKSLTGDGGRSLPRALCHVQDVESPLDRRILAGFGGVSEYGITVRWDKNFLTLIHLTLARRDHFRFYSGVRFGGTLTIEDAWELGFDHIAIAAGAGRPTVIKMRNNLIRGIRKASDFLMALQLTGAFKQDAMANLQVRLPAVVIGGGLTAIDTATELMAYYPAQVEKMLARFEQLEVEIGVEEIWSRFTSEEREVTEEFLRHGRAIREERERARAAGETPDFASLVRAWGGVSIVYRKRLQDSPAYRLNHEEVAKALEEGINFVENLNPAEAVPGEYGAISALVFERMRYRPEEGRWRSSGQMVRLPARTVCVAAGTSPNTIYEKEHPGTFKLDKWGDFFAPFRLVQNGDGFHLQEATQGERAFFTSYNSDGRFITYYGDNHPVYAGNVVKAMASAKFGYEQVVRLFASGLAKLEPCDEARREQVFQSLVEGLDRSLIARVVRIERLTSTIVEVVVHAPLQARKFQPGQFYRLQNFETDSPSVDGSRLMMEGLALTGAWVDRDRGLLSLIVLEMGASSRLCALLERGQEVIVMGPTGTPTEIPSNETVLLAGGGLGNAVLFSIARAMREQGNRVIYFAGYRRGEDLFKRGDIESATDQVIWSTDAGDEIVPERDQDVHFRGNIVEAMVAYAEGRIGRREFSFSDINRVVAIGSDRMMAAVKTARHGVLAPYLNQNHIGIGSINSPMQCMMKEVCAQCLQRHVDPVTGEEHFVFSCFNQDQLLDEVDFDNLNERLRSNTIQEKVANMWLDQMMVKPEIARRSI